MRWRCRNSSQTQLAELEQQRQETDPARPANRPRPSGKKLLAEAEQAIDRTAAGGPRRPSTASARRRCRSLRRRAASARPSTWRERLLGESADRTLATASLPSGSSRPCSSCPRANETSCGDSGTAQDGAVLETAGELDGRPLQAGHRAVAALLGQPVTLAVQAKPALVAGARLRLGGHVWDASLAGQLDAVKPRREREAERAMTRSDATTRPASCARHLGTIHWQVRQHESRLGRARRRRRGLPARRAIRSATASCCERSDGLTALAFDLRRDEVGVLFLDPAEHVSAGDELRPTGRVASVPVGDELLGRVVDALGRPLDGGPPISARPTCWPVEREAPGVIDRQPVREPLHTGIKVIDALLPLGRGQRELILGDRATGKTAIALDAILAQRGTRRAVRLCRHRPAQGQRRRDGRAAGKARRPGAHGRRRRRRRLAARAAVPGPVRGLHDRRVLHAPGPARAGGLRRSDQACRRLPADLAAAGPAARARSLSRPTSFICTPGCWSGPPGCTTGWAAAA